MNWLSLNKPQWCFLHLVIAAPSLVGYFFLSVSFGKSKDICRSLFAICSYKLFMGVQKNINPILWYLHLESAQRSSVPHIGFAVQFLFQIIIWDLLEYILRLKCQTEKYLGGTYPSGILTHGVCPLGVEQLDKPWIGLDRTGLDNPTNHCTPEPIIMPCSTKILVNNRLQGPMLFYRLILAKHDKSKYTKIMTHRTGTWLIFQGLTRATICVAQILKQQAKVTT